MKKIIIGLFVLSLFAALPAIAQTGMMGYPQQNVTSTSLQTKTLPLIPPCKTFIRAKILAVKIKLIVAKLPMINLKNLAMPIWATA